MQDGDPPSLFKDGAPVVCEGHWAKTAGPVFDSDRILIKHGDDYEPPKVKLPDEHAGDASGVKSSLGVLALVLGACAAGLGVITLGAGLRRDDERLLRLGRRYVFVVLIASFLAVVVMEWALISHDFSLQYVADNNARGTPLLFTITGLWAALEGSILLWAFILGGYLAFTAHKFRARATDPVVAWATIVGLLVALFFFILMLGPANPFKEVTGTVPLDGRGPNALLQNNPLMAFHPPILYLGYVGLHDPVLVRHRVADHGSLR